MLSVMKEPEPWPYCEPDTGSWKLVNTGTGTVLINIPVSNDCGEIPSTAEGSELHSELEAVPGKSPSRAPAGGARSNMRLGSMISSVHLLAAKDFGEMFELPGEAGRSGSEGSSKS